MDTPEIPLGDRIHLWWLHGHDRDDVLAAYLGCPAEELSQVVGKNGRPSLAGERAGRLSFSTSHSGGLSLLAVGPADRDLIGVDLELCQARAGWERLTRRVLTPAELAEAETLAERERVERWILSWAAKEAYLKAIGTGLQEPPRGVVTSVDATGDPRLVSQPAVGAQVAAGRPWHLRRVAPPADGVWQAPAGGGYIAVLAVAGAWPRITHHRA
jgi:phosphopantetheinyl transferase